MTESEGELLSTAAITAFRLNGQFMTLAEELAKPAGLTASWWQVLGAVVDEPLPVSGIARAMGITRQSVQRIADLLVNKGLAEYHDNPAHRRAKLVTPTQAGFDAMHAISPQHAVAARKLADAMGVDELEQAVRSLQKLTAAMDRLTD